MTISTLRNLVNHHHDTNEIVHFVQEHSITLSHEYEENSDLHRKVINLKHAPLNDQIEKVLRRTEIFKLKKILNEGNDQKIQAWLTKNQAALFRLEDLGFSSELMLAEIDAVGQTETLTKVAVSILGFKDSAQLNHYRIQLEKVKAREELLHLNTLLQNGQRAEIGAWALKNQETLSFDLESLGFEPLTLYTQIRNIRRRMEMTPEIDEALSKLAAYALGFKGKTIGEAKAISRSYFGAGNLEAIAHYINAYRLPLTEAHLSLEELMAIAPHLTYVDMWHYKDLNLGIDRHLHFISRCQNAYHLFVTRKSPPDLQPGWIRSESIYMRRIIIRNLNRLPPKLRTLHVDIVDLQSIDLSNCKHLEEFQIEKSSELISLDVSRNTRLQKLTCYRTGIRALDLSRNPDLQELDCSYSEGMSRLELTNNRALKKLYLNGLKLLPAPNLSNKPQLEALHVAFCAYTQLNLASNPLLKDLDCCYCPLTTLDLSNNPLLEKLNGSHCRFTLLNLEKQTQLKELNTMGCPLSSLDISKNTRLQKLWSGGNFNSLDVSKNTLLELLWCTGHLRTIDLSKNTLLQELKSGNCRRIDLSKNKHLVKLVCPAVDSLDLSHNLMLEVLDCSGNKNLGHLDLCKNIALKELKIDNIKIKHLDLSANKELLYLSCSFCNNLKNLDLSANTKLRILAINGIPVESLNLVNNKELKNLYCSGCPITILELGQNSLEELVCRECLKLKKIVAESLSHCRVFEADGCPLLAKTK